MRQKAFLPRNVANLAQKTRSINGIYQPRTSNKDHPAANTVHANDSMTSYSPSNLHISLPDSTTRVTDVEKEQHTVSSTVSVKRIKRSDMMNINNTENLDETKNSDIQATNHRGSRGNNAAIRRPSVIVLGMNKLPNTDETNKRNSKVTQQNTQSTMLKVPSNNAQVNATRIPRNKTSKTQRTRAGGVGNFNIIHLDESSIEMRKIEDHSNAPTGAAHDKANTGSGVVVTKISRNLTASQSYLP